MSSSIHSNLTAYGWNDGWQEAWQRQPAGDWRPGRVVADFGAGLQVAVPEVISAEVAGSLEYTLRPDEWPKIGDWVAVAPARAAIATIMAVLPRATELVRKAAGTGTFKQVVAANVDVALIVQAAGGDFNPNRLDRYVFQVSAAGITPVVVINKIDAVTDADRAAMMEQLNVPCAVIVASQATGEGAEALLGAVAPGQTAVLLGSSGVGKSTITNRLMRHDVQKTAQVRGSDERGRHTTTHRELFLLPGGGILIDTPGVRELALWGEAGDLEAVFPELARLAPHCRFSDCAHAGEPGCAVTAAIAAGELSARQLASYHKMKRELQHLEGRTDTALSLEAKKKNKALNRNLTRLYRHRDR